MSAAISRSEIPSSADIPAATLQRVDGTIEIGFARHGGGSAVSHLYQRNPCRVEFPKAEAGEPALGMLLNTAGGLTGGDRVSMRIEAGADSAATITGAAAEKIYRSLGADCDVTIELAAGDGAWLEWLPQETILFARSRLRRTIAARIAGTGRLLAAEMLVFGRVARGESWTGGMLRERWRVERGGALAWFDATDLDERALAAPAGLGGAEAFATALYVGADATQHRHLAREAMDSASCRAGVTLVNGVLIARFLGAAVETRAALAAYIGALRRAAAGLLPQAPRIWNI